MIRSAIGTVALLLVLLPVRDIAPAVRWNLHVWQRLREAHRVAPDTAYDGFYGELASYLPRTGRVGLVTAPAMTATESSRVQYFLQYALAPRFVVRSSDPAYLVTVGPASATAPLFNMSQFALVNDFGDDVRLFRRIAR